MTKLPLEGVRVLDISAYISGPYAGAMLRSLGAEVVKIEPREGEAFRIGMNAASPYFAQYNAGKKSVALDLKSPKAVAAVKALLPGFDVLIENMRPGKLAALGLGPDVCRQINPKLIYTSISGFGSGGPYRDRPAFDSIGQSLGGLYTIMNDADDVRLTGTCVADLITAISATMAILSALAGSARNGDGGLHIETSVFESVSMLTADAMTQALSLDMDPIRTTRHPQAQNLCAKTASHDFITIHLSSSEKFWRALLRVVEREDLITDPRFPNYAARSVPATFETIRQIMQAEFLKRTRDEWEERLLKEDVPYAPALTMREVANLDQTEWLDILDKNAAGQPLIRPPWRFDGARPDRPHDIPVIGEHTRAVLREVLSDEEIDAL